MPLPLLALALLAPPTEQTYLGLYLQGQKIGYVSEIDSPAKLDGVATSRSDSRTVLDLGLMGTPLKMTIDASTVAQPESASTTGMPLVQPSLAELARADGVRFLLAMFVDLTGKPCAKLVPVESADELQHEGVGFAGYAVGAIGQQPSDPDLIVLPDLSSYTPLPWVREGLALVHCDPHVEGEPLRELHQVDHLADRGAVPVHHAHADELVQVDLVLGRRRQLGVGDEEPAVAPRLRGRAVGDLVEGDDQAALERAGAPPAPARSVHRPARGRFGIGPAQAHGDARRRAGGPATARVPPLGVPGAPRRPGGDADHALGGRVGLPLRPQDQHRRDAH